jgi:hypothetical protein
MQVLVDALAVSSGKNCTKRVDVHPDGDLESQIRENLSSDHGVMFGQNCAIRMHETTDGDKVIPSTVFPYKT